MARIAFSNSNTAFFTALKTRVDEYFTSNNLHLTGNRHLYLKTILLFCSAICIYTILVFYTPAAWLSILLCMVMGVNVAAIGFNVMHDGAHGSYSQKPWVNDLMAYSLDLLGGCSYLWKQKHNVNHHSYTNIEGFDDDIDIKPFIRTNTNQPKKWFHRYQHVYWGLLYAFTYLFWIFFADFRKYFTGMVAGIRFRKMGTKDHFIFWAGKAIYIFLFIGLPWIKAGFVPMLTGYLTVSIVCGIVLAIVFQLAHVVEDAVFPVPDTGTHKMENDWAVHQLSTTANFSTQNKAVSWLLGGLNFQVEHHLFPRISHIHYPALSKVVKNVCAEFNVKYIEFPTVLSALKSHVLHLKHVGQQ